MLAKNDGQLLTINKFIKYALVWSLFCLHCRTIAVKEHKFIDYLLCPIFCYTSQLIHQRHRWCICMAFPTRNYFLDEFLVWFCEIMWPDFICVWVFRHFIHHSKLLCVTLYTQNPYLSSNLLFRISSLYTHR